MTFGILESAAVLLTLLAGRELRRQKRSWPFTLTSSALLLAALTLMISIWRGL